MTGQKTSGQAQWELPFRENGIPTHEENGTPLRSAYTIGQPRKAKIASHRNLSYSDCLQYFTLSSIFHLKILIDASYYSTELSSGGGILVFATLLCLAVSQTRFNLTCPNFKVAWEGK